MNANPLQHQGSSLPPAQNEGDDTRYSLKLFVTGATPRSLRAITNLKRICEERLKGRYVLEVIDVYQQPALAKGEQIVAAPTLIKQLPLPIRRLIGDMTDNDRVLIGLGLSPNEKTKEGD